MQRVYHSIIKDVDELCKHLIYVLCELDHSVVNHAIDEWSVCQPVSTLKADILNIIYNCYSRNNNVEMAAL